MLKTRVILILNILLTSACASTVPKAELDAAQEKLTRVEVNAKAVESELDTTMAEQVKLNYRLAQKIYDLEMLMLLNEMNSVDVDSAQYQTLNANYNRLKAKSLDDVIKTYSNYRVDAKMKALAIEQKAQYRKYFPNGIISADDVE